MTTVATAGRPEREPQHPVHPRPAEHLEHPTDVEAAVGDEPAADHAGDRQHEEHREHQQGQGRQCDDPGGPPVSTGSARLVIGW